MGNPNFVFRPNKTRWLARSAQIIALVSVFGPFLLEMFSFLQGRKILRATDPVFSVPFSTSVGLLICMEAVVIFCLIWSKTWIKSLSLVALGAVLAAYNILFYYCGGPRTICPCFGSLFDPVPVLMKHRELVKVLYIVLLFTFAKILIVIERRTSNPTNADTNKAEKADLH
jgi:hypothetical protein